LLAACDHHLEDADRNLYLAGARRERLAEGQRSWRTGRTDPAGSRAPAELGRPEGPRLLWPGSMLPEGFAGLAGPPIPGPRPIVALNIEATQHQSTFVREILARTNLPARAVYLDRDKVTRARTLAARYDVAAYLDPTRPSRARPTPDDLVAVADATGITLVELLEGVWGIDRRRLADELAVLGVGTGLGARYEALSASDRAAVADYIDFLAARRRGSGRR
jgi:hypothetical protein